jgi:hypothetical protein
MSSTTVTKTITTALWDYTTPQGTRRIGYRGEVVELSAQEAERGDKAGVFNQPPAGVVIAPALPHDVLADNFAGVYDVVKPRVTVPPSDDVVAPLRHDVQAVTPPVGDPGDEEPGEEVAQKPPPNATKPVLVAWLADNAVTADGSDYTAGELDGLSKATLWAMINEVE